MKRKREIINSGSHDVESSQTTLGIITRLNNGRPSIIRVSR